MLSLDCKKLVKFHKDILELLEPAKLVGGCVRDYLLKKTISYDIDISTKLLPDEVFNILKKKYKNCYISDRNKLYGTINIIIGKFNYDITTTRSDIQCFGRQAKVQFCKDFLLDSHRRDFTFNALYAGIDGKILDFHSGINDLNNHVVRFIGDAEKRIKEDYLRIVRYFRFLAKLNFKIDKKNNKYIDVIVKNKDGLKNISHERIRNEIFKIDKVSIFYVLKLFKNCDLIEDIFLLKNSIKTINNEPDVALSFNTKKIKSDNTFYIIYFICFFFKFSKDLEILKKSLCFSKKECIFLDFIIEFWHLTNSGYELTFDAKMEIFYLFKKNKFDIKNAIDFIKNVCFSFSCGEDVLKFVKKCNKCMIKAQNIEHLKKLYSGKALGDKIKQFEQEFISKI